MHKFPQRNVHIFCLLNAIYHDTQMSHLCTLHQLKNAMSDEANSVPYDGRLFSVGYNCISTESDKTENL